MRNGSVEDMAADTVVNPVTLSADWSRVARLLLVTAMVVAGNVGNVFMISAVIIEDHLRKRGNSFIVNIALADMLITGMVMPASVIALLANRPETTQSVCTVQWSLALVSCLVSLLTLATSALENFLRLCLPNCYSHISSCHITTIVLIIWIASITAVVIQIALNLGPDYCHLTSQGLVPYQIAVGVGFVVVPVVMTVLCFILLLFRAQSSNNTQPAYRSQVIFNADYEVAKTNMLSFAVFVVFWLPFGCTLVLGPLQSVSRRLFYNLAWFALSKSCVNNLVYCVTNRYFRNAYVNLFHYCCCKTTVSFSRRAREPVRSPGDVRVHIIPAYNINYSSPNRGREVTKGSCKRSAASRPVTYEL